MPTEIKIHPAADLFPMMGPAEFESLLADVRERGIQTCIKLVGEDRDTAKLIDGRNRLKAMLEIGLDPFDSADIIHPDDLGDPIQYVLSLNLHRRHLSESQRGMVANKVATLRDGERRGSSIDLAATQQQAAEQLNVGVATVKRARKVQEKAVPAIAEAVERGEVSVSAAAVVADLPKAEQQKLAEAGPEAVKDAASTTRKKKTSTPAVKPAPKADPKADPKAGPFKELREMFDEMDKPDAQAAARLAEWVLKQRILEDIHSGCAVWIQW